MKTLKEKFGELSAKIKASGQPARVWFPQYTPASLLSAENWWEALAVCEYALDTKEDEKLTEDFFELIFSAFDCNVEVELNAEEYEFWWEKVMQVCDRVAEFSGGGMGAEGCTIFRSPLWKAGHELFVSILREGRRYGLG